MEGRVTLADRVMAMSPEAQAAALMVLDEMSRPLTAREIERALRNHGVVKSRAVLFAASLCKLHLIAVVGGEAANG
jgi:repressor of nif and glnA expression